MSKTYESNVALSLEEGKFIPKVAVQGKSPVWKDFSLVVNKESEENQEHAVCYNWIYVQECVQRVACVCKNL